MLSFNHRHGYSPRAVFSEFSSCLSTPPSLTLNIRLLPFLCVIFADRDQELHVEESHACASGNYCTQITDEDIDMDMDSKRLLLCRECTHLHKVESIFCSLRCADNNFRRHREDVHIPGRTRRSIQVNRDIDDIVFDADDRSRYHARDIKLHVVSLDDMLEEFAQKNGIDIH